MFAQLRQFASALGLAATLALIAASPAEARRSGGGGSQEALLFIAETAIPNPEGGGTLALCHLVKHLTIFFVPVWTEMKGYAVAPDACTSDSYYDVDELQFKDGQKSGVFPISLPTAPELPRSARLRNWATLGAAALFLAFGLLGAARRAMRPARAGRRFGPKRDMTVASRALMAMCQVAKVDGQIDRSELKMINATLARITGRSFALSQISRMAEEAEPATDLRGFGELSSGLDADDRRMVLECALSVAVADGRIETAEHSYVTSLSRALDIGGDEFRTILGRIARHLHAQPSPS